MLKKTVFFCGATFSFAFLVWSAGLFYFVSLLKQPVSDNNDLIPVAVVLTGGTDRIATGISLLKEKKARQLFISGVNRQIDFKRLSRRISELPEDLSDEITLGHIACNTYENALETKQWLTENGINRFRLVTSAYHLPRSLAEFRYMMPDADIVPYPVFSENVKLNDWWFHKGTAKLILSEYIKYIIINGLHLLPQKYETVFKQSEGKCR